MTNFLKFSYWFESLPTPFLPWVLRFLLTSFIGLVVLGVILHLLARQRRENRVLLGSACEQGGRKHRSGG